MRKNTYSDPENARGDAQPLIEGGLAHGRLPNRLMTVFEVAAFVGCHTETIRRAYWRGLLTSQRFGARGRRFHPADVQDWIRRGAPTTSFVIHDNGANALKGGHL
jgi:excisionase family DNA binding protein